jgi:hypothetical protein
MIVEKQLFSENQQHTKRFLSEVHIFIGIYSNSVTENSLFRKKMAPAFSYVYLLSALHLLSSRR